MYFGGSLCVGDGYHPLSWRLLKYDIRRSASICYSETKEEPPTVQHTRCLRRNQVLASTSHGFRLSAVDRNVGSSAVFYIWKGSGGMLTIAEAQQRTELFLTGQMLEALQAVEYELPSFDTEPREVQLADAARSRVQLRHVRGAS